MVVRRIHTYKNIAEPLIKPLPQPKHQSHTRKLGLKHIGEWLYMYYIICNICKDSWIYLFMFINKLIVYI